MHPKTNGEEYIVDVQTIGIFSLSLFEPMYETKSFLKNIIYIFIYFQL